MRGRGTYWQKQVPPLRECSPSTDSHPFDLIIVKLAILKNREMWCWRVTQDQIDESRSEGREHFALGRHIPAAGLTLFFLQR